MDKAILASLTTLGGAGITGATLVILFAGYWEYLVVAVILGYLLIVARPLRRERALVVGLALLSAAVARFGVVSIIRFLYDRPRPFVTETFVPLLDHSATASFPSGHAAFFMALAVYVLLTGRKKIGWFLFASAILIGLARVAAGIHWPSDILVGWAVGALTSVAVWYFTKKKLLPH